MPTLARSVEPRRSLALALGVALLGLAALFAYAASLHPTPMTLADIGGDDLGRYVAVTGTVRSSETTRSGGGSVELLDLASFASLQAFITATAWASFPDRAAVVPGAELAAIGELEDFGGEIVLQVSLAEDLQVLRAAGEVAIPLRTLAERASDLEGMRITARGVLSDVRAVLDPLRLRLTDGVRSLWAFAPEAPEGTVDLCGRLEWSPLNERWELAVDTAGRSPSELPCEAMPFGGLTADPAAHAGRRVGIVAVTATRGELLGTAFLLREGSVAVAGFLRGEPMADAVRQGDLVEFTATLEYYAGEARFRLVGDAGGIRSA